MNHPIQQEQNPDPWAPDGMPEFTVGMKVRWRISPEREWVCGGRKVVLPENTEYIR